MTRNILILLAMIIQSIQSVTLDKTFEATFNYTYKSSFTMALPATPKVNGILVHAYDASDLVNITIFSDQGLFNQVGNPL